MSNPKEGYLSIKEANVLLENTKKELRTVLKHPFVPRKEAEERGYLIHRTKILPDEEFEEMLIWPTKGSKNSPDYIAAQDEIKKRNASFIPKSQNDGKSITIIRQSYITKNPYSRYFCEIYL